MKKTKSLVLCLLISSSLGFIGCSNKDKSNEDSFKVSVEEPKKETKTKLEFSSSSIPDNLKEKMLGKSMPEDEPISFDSLSYLRLTYYGFDKQTHVGEMIVNKEVASDIVDIFKELYEKKYPIEKMNLIDEYNASDEKSMNDNNSSAFCYRTIANTSVISNHGRGLAIDINPFQNPQVVNGVSNPIEASNFSDRSNIQFGMIVKGDDCYNAFISRGWTWGGDWNNPDYQHFEKSI